MKAKRLLALALGVMMMISAFAGCSKSEPGEEENKKEPVSQTQEKTEEITEDVDVPAEETGITSKESFVNTMSKLIDLSLYMDLSESYNGSYDTFSYRIKYENEKDYDLDKKVRLADGSEFTLPIKVSDLANKGWTIPSNSSPDAQLKSGYETPTINFKNSAGKQFEAAVYNHTDITTAVKNGTVTEIRTHLYGSLDPNKKLDSGIGFTVCGTITENSSMEGVIARLGNPTSVFCTVRRDDTGAFKHSTVEIKFEQSAYNYLTITFSGDKGYITEMKYSADVR